MKLLFATGNKGKLREAGGILGENIEIVSPAELGISGDVRRPGLPCWRIRASRRRLFMLRADLIALPTTPDWRLMRLAESPACTLPAMQETDTTIRRIWTNCCAILMR